MACVDCFRGGISDVEPRGTEAIVHGLSTYIAQPEAAVAPKGIIIYIPDAFGWKAVNNRTLADRYAKNGGFLVYLPDFMAGGAADPDIIPIGDKILEPASWWTTLIYKPIYLVQLFMRTLPFLFRCRISVTHPRVVSFAQALRKSPPPFPTDRLKIGAVGFCWGGKHTVLLAQDVPSTRAQRHESQIDAAAGPAPLLDCAFTAHPSLLNVPKDVNPISLPLSVAIGEVDMALSAPHIQLMKKILEAKDQGQHEFNIIPGAKHGFAVRTHRDDPYEMECAQRAEDQAISWFSRWFA